MATLILNNVYIQSSFSIVGPMENMGPLSKYYDYSIDNLYFGKDSYEQAEEKMIRYAILGVLNKVGYQESDISLILGGDLQNQIASSSYAARILDVPFLGVYGACSTSILSLGLASLIVDNTQLDNCLSFASSHFATAEKQFRYPNEYGCQKKDSSTYTVTGC